MNRMTFLIAVALVAIPARAADLYRWTDPETGKIMVTPAPPPYAIKEQQPGGRLPGGDVIKLIFDENSPQYKAAAAKRKAAEMAQQRLAEEKAEVQAHKEAEQRRIADEKAASDAENARLEARNAAIRAEQQRIKDEEQAKRAAEATKREATSEETQECFKLLKAQYAYKDPESMRVEGERWIVLYKDGERFININVNAKNSFGGYVGAKPVYCSFKPNAEPAVIAVTQ